MAKSLLESYKNRLALAEQWYGKNHSGEKMDSGRTLMIAKCLENTNKFLNEQFEQSVGTQRSALGD